MTEREALKIALKGLNIADLRLDHRCHAVHVGIQAINEALAQPEQEPVGFTIQAEIDYAKNNPKEYAGFWANKDDDDEDWIALYTNPPQRKPLTDEQITQVANSVYGETDVHSVELIRIDFARAIEAAHRIKGDA